MIDRYVRSIPCHLGRQTPHKDKKGEAEASKFLDVGDGRTTSKHHGKLLVGIVCGQPEYGASHTGLGRGIGKVQTPVLQQEWNDSGWDIHF
jgi:hypothetical protein